jgi:hypothetical protein
MSSISAPAGPAALAFENFLAVIPAPAEPFGLMTGWPGRVALNRPGAEALERRTGTSGAKSPRSDEGDASRTLDKSAV